MGYCAAHSRRTDPIGNFPHGPIKASGALAGFTVNVTGAFEAYVIVFLLTGPIVSRMEDALGASLIPMWTINARVNVVEENGKPANPRLLDSLAVEPNPPVYNHSNEMVEISVPERNNSLHRLVFTIGNFGSTAINLDDPRVKMSRNESKRQITLDQPVTIARYPNLNAVLDNYFQQQRTKVRDPQGEHSLQSE